MDIIVYHKDCPDGFCSAFIAKKKYPDAVLFGATYGEPVIPCKNVQGKNVLFVDFSYPREDLCGLKEAANTLLVLDHHKTAEKNLEGLDFAVFDMNRSGATLTWDTLFPGQSRPWYVDYVEDRDLWKWKLSNSKEVSGYVMALPHTIEAWSALENVPLESAIQGGKAIRLHIDHYIEKVVAQKQKGSFCGYTVYVVNAAYPNISDVANVLCNETDIGMGWFERGDGMVQFSLRSIGDIDVSEMSKKYGGGGHKNASGFQLELAEGRELLDNIFNREIKNSERYSECQKAY